MSDFNIYERFLRYSMVYLLPVSWLELLRGDSSLEIFLWGLAHLIGLGAFFLWLLLVKSTWSFFSLGELRGEAREEDSFNPLWKFKLVLTCMKSKLKTFFKISHGQNGRGHLTMFLSIVNKAPSENRLSIPIWTFAQVFKVQCRFANFTSFGTSTDQTKLSTGTKYLNPAGTGTGAIKFGRNRNRNFGWSSKDCSVTTAQYASTMEVVKSMLLVIYRVGQLLGLDHPFHW